MYFLCVCFFFFFHTFLLTLTFISLIWGFLSYHCLLPLLVAFWDLGGTMRVGGKEIQCYSHNCSAPRSGMPRTVPPPQHRGTGSWLQWGEHLLLQTPQPSSSGSSGCSPMKVRGHIKSRQEITKCCRGMQRADSSCKSYPDVNKELLPNQSVVRVLVWGTGLRGKKNVSGGDGNLT